MSLKSSLKIGANTFPPATRFKGLKMKTNRLTLWNYGRVLRSFFGVLTGVLLFSLAVVGLTPADAKTYAYVFNGDLSL